MVRCLHRLSAGLGLTNGFDLIFVLFSFKKTEPTLRDIAGSFRCYADGLNFSSELFQYSEK